jgi:hypothetical protein
MMAPHYCEVRKCRAMLLGNSYFGVKLSATATDRARTVALCPACMRKVRAAASRP